jgi:hypothetical protein
VKSLPVRHATRPLAPLAALLALAALGACEPRRDVADMAVGIAPFEELRGLGFRGLRAGMVRAFRASATRAPLEGFREAIGAHDVVYTVPGYVGTDSTWPNEDALIEDIEASRAWPSDSLARAAYDRVVSEYSTLGGARPTCYTITGDGFSMRQAEWALGDGFAFTASFAPRSTLTNGTVLPALHSLAVRRRMLRDRLPAAGASNPDDHPTWQRLSCDE